ncbi:hypothetical protein IFT47_22675 [Pseudomonas sp. CFBP 13711]|uniref:hypothetical protein n=1 Tax=unclassified Pseudomonas TaxID=196821 RepID=UPI001783CA40|nr:MULTISPECIES: hypothetical protein [unclassified Pseudomonas]MBD8709441.1 hypothetical protein [Pseudomonas sp. CFBP 13711]MBD8714477.1 hypothetical protein [Pseudomonas sp. CFBP 13715]
MTAKELVEIDVGLILLRHGKAAVLTAIANRVGVSEDELYREIERLRVAKEAAISRKKKIGGKFNIESFLIGRDNKAASLKKLSERFDNRTFLPELKDLKRFFERHGASASNLKSRVSAQTKLFKMLADFGEDELERILAETPERSRVSSLGLISDEILGRSRRSDSQKKDVPNS